MSPEIQPNTTNTSAGRADRYRRVKRRAAYLVAGSVLVGDLGEEAVKYTGVAATMSIHSSKVCVYASLLESFSTERRWAG